MSLPMRSKSAIVLCDLQQRVIANIPQRRRIIANIQTLITHNDMRTSHRNNYYRNNRLSEFATPPRVIVAEFLPDKLGRTDLNVMNAVNNSESDVTHIDQDIYTIYSDDLANDLRTQDIRTIALTGARTDLCVINTARDFANHNFNVDVIQDAVGSPDITEHEYALNRMDRMDNIELHTTHSYIIRDLVRADDQISRWYVGRMKAIQELDDFSAT